MFDTPRQPVKTMGLRYPLWAQFPRERGVLPNYARALVWMIPLLLGLGHAQVMTRHIYTGVASNGAFNLVANESVPVGEEVLTIRWYESQSTMQLRRQAYSTVSYAYAGIDAANTLHLRRRFTWPERNIDETMDVHVKLDTPLTFRTSFEGPQAQLVFREGENGLVSALLVNDPPFATPKNEGF